MAASPEPRRPKPGKEQPASPWHLFKTLDRAGIKVYAETVKDQDGEVVYQDGKALKELAFSLVDGTEQEVVYESLQDAIDAHSTDLVALAEEYSCRAKVFIDGPWFPDALAIHQAGRKGTPNWLEYRNRKGRPVRLERRKCKDGVWRFVHK